MGFKVPSNPSHAMIYAVREAISKIQRDFMFVCLFLYYCGCSPSASVRVNIAEDMQ